MVRSFRAAVRRNNGALIVFVIAKWRRMVVGILGGADKPNMSARRVTVESLLEAQDGDILRLSLVAQVDLPSMSAPTELKNNPSPLGPHTRRSKATYSVISMKASVCG